MLMYRAMWVDPRGGLPDRVRRSVEEWALDKSSGFLAITDGTNSVAAEYVTRRGDNVRSELTVEQDQQLALRARLVEDYAAGNRFTTTVRSWPVGENYPPGSAAAAWWVWVDVDALGPTADQIDFVVPNLVRKLHPRFAAITLVEDYQGVTGGDEIVAELRREQRADAIALLAEPDDPADRHPGLIDELTRGAREVAGVARLATVDHEAADRIQESIGYHYRIEPGQLRIYLPGINPADLRDRSRHRFVLPHRFRFNPRVALREIKLAASAYSSVRRPPRTWDAANAALATASDTKDAGSAYQTRIDDLAARLAEAERVATIFSAQVDDQREQLALLVNDLAVESEKANRMTARLEDAETKLQRALGKLWGNDAAAAAEIESHAGQTHIPTEAFGLTGAAQQAREYLANALVLPEEACRDLEHLDSTDTALAWGNTAWRGFRALHAYAGALRNGYSGNFQAWCQNSGSPWVWPNNSKKLSMTESKTVRDRYLGTRMLPISTDVEPSGRIEMLAHLKVAEGGGDLAPRIYFHVDDATKTVHVGFFGPHRYMPNTKTS